MIVVSRCDIAVLIFAIGNEKVIVTSFLVVVVVGGHRYSFLSGGV